MKSDLWNADSILLSGLWQGWCWHWGLVMSPWWEVTGTDVLAVTPVVFLLLAVISLPCAPLFHLSKFWHVCARVFTPCQLKCAACIKVLPLMQQVWLILGCLHPKKFISVHSNGASESNCSKVTHKCPKPRDPGNSPQNTPEQHGQALGQLQPTSMVVLAPKASSYFHSNLFAPTEWFIRSYPCFHTPWIWGADGAQMKHQLEGPPSNDISFDLW